MTSGTQPFTPDELEFLDLGQAAAICAVSQERFNRWIEKGVVPVILTDRGTLIRSHDLIQHLIRHNIPVPERLLQGNYKKVLFVLGEQEVPQTTAAEIVQTLFRLKKEAPLIFDFVHNDENIELKIITLQPDVIILFLYESNSQEPARLISRMTNGAIPVHTVTATHNIDFKSLFFDQLQSV